jgi:hypothetical protein
MKRELRQIARQNAEIIGLLHEIVGRIAMIEHPLAGLTVPLSFGLDFGKGDFNGAGAEDSREGDDAAQRAEDPGLQAPVGHG